MSVACCFTERRLAYLPSWPSALARLFLAGLDTSCDCPWSKGCRVRAWCKAHCYQGFLVVGPFLQGLWGLGISFRVGMGQVHSCVAEASVGSEIT